MNTFTDPFLTPQQAAALINRSHDFILRLCHAKKLAHFRIGKRIGIKRSDFDAYLASTRVEVAVAKQTVPAMTVAQRKRLHEAAGLHDFKPRKRAKSESVRATGCDSHSPTGEANQ